MHLNVVKYRLRVSESQRYIGKWPIRPALISGFCSMKRLGVFLLLVKNEKMGC